MRNQHLCVNLLSDCYNYTRNMLNQDDCYLDILIGGVIYNEMQLRPY